MANDYDFVVIGGGLVGCLTSLALAKHGSTVCLYEKNKFNIVTSDVYSPLSLTLNTQKFLESLDLWDQENLKGNPIERLTVKAWNSFNKSELSSQEINEKCLGAIVDKTSLLNKFREKCISNKNITIEQNSSIHMVNSGKNYAIKSNEDLVKAKNIFVTDGADSNTASEMRIESKKINYRQTSFIFNCNCESSVNTAHQIFTEHGVFAILPVNSKLTCIVATIKDEHKELFNFDSQNFNLSRLSNCLKPYAKEIKSMKLIYSHPLNTSRLRYWIKNNVIFVGNSSQLLHPFGAQGFNFSVYSICEITSNIEKLSNDLNTFKPIIDRIDKHRQYLFNAIDLSEKFLLNKNLFTGFSVNLFFKMLNKSSSIKNYFTNKILSLYE